MKNKVIVALSSIGLVGFFLLLQLFPNAWLLVISGLIGVGVFFQYKLFKDDDRVVRHVEKAHPLRLIIFLLPGLVLGCFLTGLTLWGVYLHLVEASLFDTTEIVRTGHGKSIPSGTYSNAVLLIGISAFCALFGSVTFFVLRSTVTGLRYRFGLAKPAVVPVPVRPPVTRKKKPRKKR